MMYNVYIKHREREREREIFNVQIQNEIIKILNNR